MKIRLYLFAFILIFANSVLGSTNYGSEIPLPGEKDIENYIWENINRFNNTKYLKNSGVNILNIKSIPAWDSLFHNHRIFQVSIMQGYLEGGVNSFGSSGYFSTDGHSLLYLSRTNKDNIEALFMAERCQIDAVFKTDKNDFLHFLCQTLIADGSIHYNLLFSTSGLVDFEQKNEGYEVNNKALKKIENKIQAPKISGHKDIGWEIEFYTFNGWMHELKTISRHLVKISTQYEIIHIEQVLTNAAFSRVPAILY